MTDTKVSEGTKAYYELFYAHKMKSDILYNSHGLSNVSFSDLMSAEVEAMKKLDTFNTFDTNSDEYKIAWHNTLEIRGEQRRLHKSLYWAQHAKGITILPSVDYIDPPF